MDTVRLHALVIAPEVVGFEEQEDPTAPCWPMAARCSGGGPRQQQGGTRAPWGNPHPALARFARLVEGRVFQQLEPQSLGKEGDGLVVIGHQQGQGANVLCHGKFLNR